MNMPQVLENESINLRRDCAATLIPAGTRVILPVGTCVVVTQALGGSVTVNVNGNLARIAGVDLDALGLEPQHAAVQDALAAEGDSVDMQLVWDQLHTCYDPEIPIDIVELGLVYSCEAVRRDDGSYQLRVEMTLTAPGCGMGPILIDDVRDKLRQVPNVADVDVQLVFEPFWNPSMMSEAARLQTGLY